MTSLSQKRLRDPIRAIFLSSFVPRECGLATFTEDVIAAVSPHGVRCSVAAMNRPDDHYSYDDRVKLTLQEDRADDYAHAAQFINKGDFDVLSVQHEFGIYGGATCPHLLAMLDAVKIPVVTTLHTVLAKPDAAMRENLQQLARRSTMIVVMNGLAIDILQQVYQIPQEKIIMIHHGAPEPARERFSTAKRDIGLEGHQIISTFGLLSSGKGLEYAVQAMPRIVEAHPEAIYLILGQTHPVVKLHEGEMYRNSLKESAQKLGVDAHIRFIDKYLTKDELLTYLMASDIYLTPYLNMEQVTSGTLAYAMACGRPLVSTPYLHAQFLLAEDRGLLVPARDPEAISDACRRILGNPDLQAEMEHRNLRYGRMLFWPHIGAQYSALFHRVARSHPQKPVTATRMQNRPSMNVHV